MVTRIYTPPVMSYYRAQQLKSQEENASGQTLAEKFSLQTPPQEIQTPANNAFSNTTDKQNRDSNQNSKPLLASARETQRIPMGTILQDFKNTLNALGVDNTTQSEVNAYLDVAAMQAQKDKPDVGFIKQSLRTAAGTLDSYISDALQQPSKVVKDWVDALLLQPIDYHLDKQPKDKQASSSTHARLIEQDSPQTNTTIDEMQENTSTPLSAQQLQAIKNALQNSKTAYQNGDLDTAKRLLLEAKSQLTPSSPLALQGRVSLQLGKIAQETHQYTDAQQYYQEAINAFQEVPNASARLAQSYLGLAETHEALGQWQQAQHYFEQSITASNNQPNLIIQAKNGLGNSLLQQGQPNQALEQFINAYQLAQKTAGQSAELPDILSNMGQVYQSQNQFTKSEKAYRLALKYAKLDGNLDSYRATLGQLVSLYDQSQNTSGYEQVLNRLQHLSPS